MGLPSRARYLLVHVDLASSTVVTVPVPVHVGWMDGEGVGGAFSTERIEVPYMTFGLFKAHTNASRRGFSADAGGTMGK